MPRRIHGSGQAAAHASAVSEGAAGFDPGTDPDGSPAPEDGPSPAAAAESEAVAARLAEAERAAAEANDRWLRAVAELQNYQKRTRAEMDDVRRYATEGLVAELLPILDNFERALEAGSSQPNAEAVTEGVRLIHRQLADALRKAGLEVIPSVGEPFDPAVHEAIGTVPAAEGQEPNQVVEELRKGYRLNGRLVRAPLVRVSGA